MRRQSLNASETDNSAPGTQPGREAQARAIGEDMLARTGQALLDGDWRAHVACFTIPHWLEGFDGHREIDSVAGLRALFLAASSYYRDHNVTDIHRNVVAAEFVAADVVHFTHETRLLANTLLVKPVHSVFSEMVLGDDGVWRCRRCRYAITGAPRLERALARAGAATDPDMSAKEGDDD